MDAKGAFAEMIDQQAAELPEIFQEIMFPAAVIGDFKSNPVWIELQKRLLTRLTDLFNKWMFVEDEKELHKLRGQAIELCYMLKTPDEMKAIEEPKKRR